MNFEKITVIALKNVKIAEKLANMAKIAEILILERCKGMGAKECTSCRFRKMLTNAPIRPRWGKKTASLIFSTPKKSFVSGSTVESLDKDSLYDGMYTNCCKRIRFVEENA